MKYLSICGAALVIAAALLLLGKEYRFPILLAGTLFYLLQAREGMEVLVSFLRETGESYRMESYLRPMLKGAGIALTCGIGGGILRDAGAASASDALEFYGCLELLLLAIPILRSILQSVGGLSG